ncbi:hypothetical protein [Plantactinospora soyae]|uniref:DUF3558 domain-containing protein n=1 Tax=Plantactinospora soyae TaxID=1544732 RepID=A0A927M418_9ACTN|nr:hypothetical protein [Plantactinospora soyae]MBE1487657.1 hypothetical protein [Plantactinospora soyae]
MPRQVWIWLRNALIVGGTLAVALFGWRLTAADAPPEGRSIDVCGFVRPETIARLVPEASEPAAEIGATNSWCEFSGWVGEGAGRARVNLWFGYVRAGREEGVSAEEQARQTVRFTECFDCRSEPTPVRIGDESFEYGWTNERTRQVAHVRVRIGTVTVHAQLGTTYATPDAVLGATRSLAQEVAARCQATC